MLDKLIATGFLRMAPDGTGAPGIDQNVARNDVVANTIKIVTTSLLGLTVGCAQCHNHRYDPIPQTDYYRIRALFEPALNWKAWQPPAGRRVSLYTDANRAAAAHIDAEAEKLVAARAAKQTKYISQTLELQLKKVPENVRERLIRIAGSRITKSGELLLVGRRYRSQERNRADVRARLVALLRDAARPVEPRRKTKPPPASKKAKATPSQAATKRKRA